MRSRPGDGVFPSSRQLWDSTFQETMPAWFEAASLTDINLKKELQALRQLQMNWEGRVSQLQELLLEKNQLIQELRDKK